MNLKDIKLLVIVVLFSGLSALLSGCSGDSGEKTSVVTSLASVSSRECISCHTSNQRSISTVSGVKITEQWLLSAHNTAEGAGCVDCHGYHYQYITPESCRNCHAKAHGQNGTSCAACHGGGSKDYTNCVSCHQMANLHKNPPIANPESAGKCLGCHNGGRNFKRYTVASRHFNNFTGAAAQAAMYVTVNYQKSCTSCHEAHNPLKGLGRDQRIAWAKSGHGDVNAPPWTHYDFSIRDTCNSCHTAAGFVKAVNNNFTDKKALSTTSLGKQPLACNACHGSSNFKNSLRKLSTGYVTPYTPSQTASNSFPDGSFVGNSQLCFPCHAGLNGGKKVETTTADLSQNKTDFGTFNSHYMAAAGVMYVKNGFTAFTSASAPVKMNGASSAASASTNIPRFNSAGAFRKYTSIPKGYIYTYGNTLTSSYDGGAITSVHRNLGTPAEAFDTGHPGGMPLVTGGPCVTCHMGFGTANHSWEINANSYNTVCSRCHTSEGGVTLTGDNFRSIFIEEQAVPFNNALKLAKQLLATKYGIEYDAASYPYFWPTGLPSHSDRTLGFKDWTKGGTLTTVQAKKLIGACFNVNLLSREPAAFAHARTYTRRLLYDTIDYLDDGTINMSTTATAMSIYPAEYGAVIPADSSTATESLIYLKAYSRTTKAWYSSERP